VRTIYLDYNATTPLDDGVREAMLQAEEAWGNPSSVHHLGQAARALLDDARDRAAVVLGCKPSELIFTSGGTESSNLAILGAARMRRDAGRHFITCAVEHHAVLHPCEYLAQNEGFDLTVLPVSNTGRVAVEAVAEAIRPDTVLVSIQAANNEVGTVQPVAEIGALCAERGVLFHSDAVQWAGKLQMPSVDCFRADLVSLCAHKLHGPKGAGLLYCKSPLQLPPLLMGGAHENERRAGTENLPGIIGLVSALEKFVALPPFGGVEMEENICLLKTCIKNIEGCTNISPPDSGDSLPNTASFIVEGSDSMALLSVFDLSGVCASSGSACSSGSITPSHVVEAMGFPSSLANALVRFSLGRETSRAEVEQVCEILPVVVSRCRL
tara:strand:+ start:158 stop:1303 length:1146 start_codon:yes stop_codon:yes gene_type:complete